MQIDTEEFARLRVKLLEQQVLIEQLQRCMQARDAAIAQLEQDLKQAQVLTGHAKKQVKKEQQQSKFVLAELNRLAPYATQAGHLQRALKQAEAQLEQQSQSECQLKSSYGACMEQLHTARTAQKKAEKQAAQAQAQVKLLRQKLVDIEAEKAQHQLAAAQVGTTGHAQQGYSETQGFRQGAGLQPEQDAAEYVSVPPGQDSAEYEHLLHLYEMLQEQHQKLQQQHSILKEKHQNLQQGFVGQGIALHSAMKERNELGKGYQKERAHESHPCEALLQAKVQALEASLQNQHAEAVRLKAYGSSGPADTAAACSDKRQRVTDGNSQGVCRDSNGRAAKKQSTWAAAAVAAAASQRPVATTSGAGTGVQLRAHGACVAAEKGEEKGDPDKQLCAADEVSHDVLRDSNGRALGWQPTQAAAASNGPAVTTVVAAAECELKTQGLCMPMDTANATCTDKRSRAEVENSHGVLRDSNGRAAKKQSTQATAAAKQPAYTTSQAVTGVHLKAVVSKAEPDTAETQGCREGDPNAENGAHPPDMVVASPVTLPSSHEQGTAAPTMSAAVQQPMGPSEELTAPAHPPLPPPVPTVLEQMRKVEKVLGVSMGNEFVRRALDLLARAAPTHSATHSRLSFIVARKGTQDCGHNGGIAKLAALLLETGLVHEVEQLDGLSKLPVKCMQLDKDALQCCWLDSIQAGQQHTGEGVAKGGCHTGSTSTAAQKDLLQPVPAPSPANKPQPGPAYAPPDVPAPSAPELPSQHYPQRQQLPPSPPPGHMPPHSHMAPNNHMSHSHMPPGCMPGPMPPCGYMPPGDVPLPGHMLPPGFKPSGYMPPTGHLPPAHMPPPGYIPPGRMLPPRPGPSDCHPFPWHGREMPPMRSIHYAKY